MLISKRTMIGFLNLVGVVVGKKILEALTYDTKVPCIVQWMLWYFSADQQQQ